MSLQLESTLGRAFGTSAVLVCDAADGLELRERADLGCLLLTAAVDVAEIIDAASVAAGVPLPAEPGMINTAHERLALWLSPRSWLVQCGIEAEGELAARLNGTFPDRRLHAALFTDYLCWLELRGAGSVDVLQDASFVSLERNGLAVGHAKRTLVAGITGVIVRHSEIDWLIGIERSRARYFTEWLTTTRTTICASRRQEQ
ncbi:sarcosine oxidase subunit gamma family protein [Steroidobacter sp.]|uniref:sarcosine oxidase subunit gamma family protein n=1 Tax=Steroidobacter sp. TaxID=1978227 RepID=UPI001A39541A|nr:sarcosine oxidase subunit gamma family protein [Steroidobacter sp.]MBL8266538.1 hypothetical protein [Steroidobacter sp.]